MIYYIAHNRENLEEAKKIVYDLQSGDPYNTYLCPALAFSHLDFDCLENFLDLLCVADCLILASEGCNDELNLAEIISMEVLKIEEDGFLRPFKK